MKILIRAHHYAVASGRYVYNTLKRLGHDAKSEGPSHGTLIPWHGGFQVEESYVWTPDTPEKGWKPELIIHMDAHLEPQGVDGALHVAYGVDNHVRDYAFTDGRRKNPYAFDHLFLGHSNGARIGEDNVTWLPCGYDPSWFVPGPEWAMRQYDTVMIGVDYPQRAELRGALLQHIPHLTVLYGLALYESFVAAHHAAKVSLVVSAANDVAQRVWETAAMGCLVVKDANHDDEALGLVDGDNCLIYHNLNEAIDKVRWALTHQTEAEKIAQAGQVWAQDGTWDQRVQVIIDWAKARSGKKAEKAVHSDDTD